MTVLVRKGNVQWAFTQRGWLELSELTRFLKYSWEGDHRLHFQTELSKVMIKASVQHCGFLSSSHTWQLKDKMSSASLLWTQASPLSLCLLIPTASFLTEPTHFSLKLQRFFAKAWLPLPLQGVAVQNKGEAEESFNMSQSQR